MFSNRLEIIDRKSLNKQHQFALWVWVVESEIASEKHHEQVIAEFVQTFLAQLNPIFLFPFKCATFHDFTILHSIVQTYMYLVYIYITQKPN